MWLSLFFLFAHAVDYLAKLALLVCLSREPGLRRAFAVLLTVHIAVSTRVSFALCFGATPRIPRRAAPVLVLLLGTVTPLMQVVQFCDAVAAWWTAQEGRRLPMRSAPLDVILEGLAFALVTLHLSIALTLGHIGMVPEKSSGFLSFEVLLALSLATSLITVTASLVTWDCTVSLKLSQDTYGWPSRGTSRGICGSGALLAHITFRASEVAGKAALLAAIAALLGFSFLTGYLLISYAGGVVVLMFSSPKEAHVWHLGAAAVLAWPLLFANLPQFVDSPKHAAAAQNAASLVCGFRALELAVAISAASAAFLLEEEAGAFASSSSLARLPAEWRILYQRRTTVGWVMCLFVHYVQVVFRWCGPQQASSTRRSPSQLAAGRPLTGSGPPHLGRALSPGLRAPAGAQQGPREGSREELDFWPPISGLAPLLLATASERAPPPWALHSSAAAPGLASGRGQERQLRVEDFDTVGLIGHGEFGKVFQVRLRSTQETFAMKRLSKDFYLRRRMADTAIREIATLHLARDHPFVVKLVYTIENAREWVMVMEYCPHGDLQQLLLREGSPGLLLGRTLKISAEVTLALEHLHARGIVFRDLKLENVVLGADGHAKLADFGLAKQHRGGRDAIAEAEQLGGVYASFTKTFCGSYGYAAPEVNTRRQVHGFAADLYSFGVLLLMMLTGGEVHNDIREPPFERRLPPETLSDLRAMVGSLTFDFYWAAHYFLRPSRASHRVEVNLHGNVVLVSRGAHMGRVMEGATHRVRRQVRPHRPPNSPRVVPGDPDSALADLSSSPARFPLHALENCEADRRRWEHALDLVSLLTDELPEHRGTVASVKQHPFFAEEIWDWRLVYPKTWLLDRLKGKLLTLFEGGPLPSYTQRRLERLTVEEIVALQDDPSRSVELLDPGDPVSALRVEDTMSPQGSPSSRPTFSGVSVVEVPEQWPGDYL